jgi:hypothetical protein
MTDYTKATDFTDKDSLPSGNPGKIVKGEEIDNEFIAIASAISSKANSEDPVFSGTVTANTVNVTGTLTAGEIDGGNY